MGARAGRLALWALAALCLLTPPLLALDYSAGAFTERPRSVLFKALFYYGCWWVFPATLLLGWHWRRHPWRLLPWGVLAGLLVWARFIEPNLILVRETAIHAGLQARVALISDLHVGVFLHRDQLDRLVDKLNSLPVDYVLVAGDWTYEPPHDLGAELIPFRRLRHPIYSVPGNHDEEMPGPPLQADLRQALLANGITPIEDRALDRGSYWLVGLGDLWAGKADPQPLLALPDRRPALVLTHEPDTLPELPPTGRTVLMAAGHTHGGQINLPWLTERVLHNVSPAGFKQGLYQRPQGQVFVTSGIGTSGLPFRFAMPPVIDVLNIEP